MMFEQINQALADAGLAPNAAPFWLVVFFALCALFFLFQSNRLAGRNRELRIETDRARVRLSGLEEKAKQIDALASDLDAEREKGRALEAEAAALSATLKERERALVEMKSRMETEFKAATAHMLDAAQKSFLERANESFARHRENANAEGERRRKALDDLLKPVSETLVRYEKGLADMRAEQEKARGEIKGQIGALSQSTQDVRIEAQKLATALRAGPKARGRWGEEQLRNVVEIAGMQAYVDFVEQESHNDGERRKQPDMVVRLPGGRVVAVDSKVSLSAYLDAIEADSEDLRASRLKQHADDLWLHVKSLSTKDYAASLRDALDYVVMFVPGESYYAAALEARPQLYQDAFDRKVLIATPTILIAMLKSAALNWRQEKMTEHAQAVAAMASDLYDSLRVMSGHLGGLGKAIDGAVKKYNSAVASYESRVLSRARKFADYEIPGVDKVIDPSVSVEAGPRALRDASGALPAPPSSTEDAA